MSAVARAAAIALAATSALAAQARQTPVVDGAWWPIAGNPDLGELTGPNQQPVDFTVWQAGDGTWQLLSCIRNTRCGGASRLFFRWQAQHLTDAHWTPQGIAMQADPNLHETAGGLQAPHVFRDGATWYLVYGDWNRICLAKSADGKRFERTRNARGEPDLFAGPYDNTRDPMVLRVGALWHCYYTGQRAGAQPQAAVFCRTSTDLRQWSEPMVVSAGGLASGNGQSPFDAECPFVVHKDGWYYLFRNQVYGPQAQNTQYASTNPFLFGVGDDTWRLGTLPVAAPEIVLDNGQYYIASLQPTLDGIRMARLRWAR